MQFYQIDLLQGVDINYDILLSTDHNKNQNTGEMQNNDNEMETAVDRLVHHGDDRPVENNTDIFGIERSSEYLSNIPEVAFDKHKA